MFKQSIRLLFYAQVRQTKRGCWVWRGALFPNGYGKLIYKGRSYYAHRISYLLHNMRFNPRLLVCHACDNPPCVRPSHLWQGTYKQNTQDMLRKGRGKHYGKAKAK